MLFHSSLRKELSRSFGATLLALVAIVMTMMLIRTLGLASRGSVNPSEVLLVMTYTVLGYMPTILSLALFVSIVGTLSRMYRDSEMAIWFSSGRGLADFAPPLFSFAWPVLLLTGALALVGWPWANGQTLAMRDQYQRRSDLDRIEPGQFQESPGRNRVFYIDKDTANGTTASNVFISSIERNREITTSARSGKVQTEGDGRYLVLSDGQRLERPLGQPDLKLSEFRTYGARLGGDTPAAASDKPLYARTTLSLLLQGDKPALAELGWRVGLLLASINFVLLALTVSSVNPRVGRSGNLLFALFLFALYYNLINLGQNWIGSGRFSAGGFLLVLHGGALVIAIGWLAKRHNNWRLGWRRRDGASAAV